MDLSIHDIRMFIHDVISGAELSIYKIIKKDYPNKVKLLASAHHPFIEILSNLHQSYFTKLNNLIIADDIDIFDNLHNKIPHSNKCILTIVANLIVTIHFNIPRESLDYSDEDTYTKSICAGINNILSDIEIETLFNHKCDPNQKMNLLGPGEKFIDIHINKKIDR